MENKFQEPPQYNQINSPAGQSQFVAQPSYGQPVIVQQSMNNESFKENFFNYFSFFSI
jgi:hypothetical protein